MEAAIKEIAASRPALCYHCGESADGGLTELIEGEVKEFCCAGCASVARYIHDCGLSEYYAKRDGFGAPPAPLPEVAPTGAALPEASSGEASLRIEGIHCAACVWLIEKVTGKMDGVVESRLNFSTQRLAVSWDIHKTDLNAIVRKIASAGYKAVPYDISAEAPLARAGNDMLVKTAVAGFSALASMFLAEGLYGGYLRGMDNDSQRFLHILSLSVSAPAVFYSGSAFLAGAWRGLKNGVLTMDLTIALGMLLTFLYSSWSVFTGKGEVFFDSASMFVFFILVGRSLEAVARKKAFSATSALMQAEPDTATVVDGEERRKTPLKAVKTGDIVEVKPGERVPLDGVIISGASRIDESLLTGESAAVHKSMGSTVYGGTVNTGGAFTFKVTCGKEETVLSKIKKLAEEGQARKAGMQKLADRIASFFIPFIIGFAALTWLYWSGHAPQKAVIYAVSVLVITCPCALALATPAAFLAGFGAGAREGILIKNGEALQALSRVTHIVLDKTGTLTEGRLSVTDVTTVGILGESEIVKLAASVESLSEHPVGKAIAAEAVKRKLRLEKNIEGFNAIPGMGVEARILLPSGWVMFLAGNGELMRRKGIFIPGILLSRENALAEAGKSSVYIAIDGTVAGLVSVADSVKKGAAELVAKLQSMGLKVTMLSGDNPVTARTVAASVGIDEVIAGVLPEGKEEVIRRFKEKGERVAMAGDGINDGPALACADVGLAMGGGAHLAIGSADLVLMKNDPEAILRAIELSRRTMKAVKGNLVLSALYNIVFAPLAAAGLAGPLVAAISMPLSSIAVIANSVRAGKTDRKKTSRSGEPSWR